jgi:hypothetical protein
MTTRLKMLLALPAMALMFSCNKMERKIDPKPQPRHISDAVDDRPDDECQNWGSSAGIGAITGALSGSVGQTIILNVTALGRNLCAQDAQVSAVTNGTNVTLSSDVYYVGCICGAAITEVPTTYSFTPQAPGTYTFTASNELGTTVTHTINVQ